MPFAVRRWGARARTHKSRLFGNRWLPQTTCADCAGSSGDLLPPSPPGEKSTASGNQPRQPRAHDRAGYQESPNLAAWELISVDVYICFLVQQGVGLTLPRPLQPSHWG